MTRLRLVHWNAAEAAERGAQVAELGFQVDHAKLQTSSMKEFRDNPPDVIVIDLSRLPSHGRELAVALRMSKATRLIPLVFVEGPPDKVRMLKQALPDARYTTYEKLGPVLDDVLREPPREVVVPKSLAGIASGRPLPQKLGLKEGDPVAVVNRPQGVEAHLPGYELRDGVDPKAGVHLWFVTSEKQLRAALPKMAKVAESSGLWILWPKQSGGMQTDLTGNKVRELCLERNLVDFKICAFDATWSGMRFAVRKKPAPVR